MDGVLDTNDSPLILNAEKMQTITAKTALKPDKSVEWLIYGTLSQDHL